MSDQKLGVSLFVITDGADNDEAMSEMKKVPGLEFELVTCPSTMDELFVCPFVKDEDDRGYYGPRSIRGFVRKRLERDDMNLEKEVVA
ncbi:MAG: hypothetical protein WC773_02045 [Patescibacteria group bacterium]